MEWRNYTGRDIELIYSNGDKELVPSIGYVYVQYTNEPLKLLDGIQIVGQEKFCFIVGLPKEVVRGVGYIVEHDVQKHLWGKRKDVFSLGDRKNNSPEYNDEKKVLSVRCLVASE